MHVDEVIELRLACSGKRRKVPMASVVHQVIKISALPGCLQCCAQVLGKGDEGGDIAGIELQRHSPAAQGLDFGHCSLRFLGLAAVGDDHIAAVPGDA